jgi:hypothetical protein
LDGGNISLFPNINGSFNHCSHGFDNTNLLVNFMCSFVIMENMKNNEGHTPFKDLTNTINGGNSS